MKYVTYERGGQQSYGVVEGDRVIDLPAALGQGAPASLLAFIQAGEATWARAASAVKSAAQSVPLSEVRLLAPIPRPAKNVFCLGLNYADHVAEGAAMGDDRPIPQHPVFFTKPPTAVIGPGDTITVDPNVSEKIDWEVELAVVVGKSGKNISAANYADYVFGYTILNDVSARDLQRRHGGQWFKGKGLDNSCPIGPWIVSKDEFGDPQTVAVETRVNGVRKQRSNTRVQIFPVATCVEALSEGMTLEAGDIIATGTPEGVGNAMNPPEFLKPGDTVELEIERIGVLSNPVKLA